MGEQGRDLDALVTERVFELEVDRTRRMYMKRAVHTASDGKQTEIRGWASCEPYSTDIAAAWTIVERCTAITPFAYRDVNGLPIATWFMAHFEKASLWSCTASEAAEAICRAALLAIEGVPVAPRLAASSDRGKGGARSELHWQQDQAHS